MLIGHRIPPRKLAVTREGAVDCDELLVMRIKSIGERAGGPLRLPAPPCLEGAVAEMRAAASLAPAPRCWRTPLSAFVPKSRIVARRKPPDSTPCLLQAQIAFCCEYAAKRRASLPPSLTQNKRNRLTLGGVIHATSDASISFDSREPSYFPYCILIFMKNLFLITNYNNNLCGTIVFEHES